ncbi:hypothetical protein RRG08_017591 [Elysia crispata]|uniref:Sulfotransferase n=1 Tax=Elysia crispata TaxID=231223 RepID=A0AAE1CX90_9GAST|nr:hypothetical protein RRG08_017591 [Elysia crispata]
MRIQEFQQMDWKSPRIAFDQMPANLTYPLLSYGPRQFSHVEEIIDAPDKVLTVSRWNNRTYPVGRQFLLPFVNDMRIRQTDISLCSYPKAGAHWAHETLHSLVNKQPQFTRYGKDLDGMIEGLPHVLFDSLPSPRVINSYLLNDQLSREIPVTHTFAGEVIKACDFENLQTVRKTQNKTLGKIYRKGIVGDWTNWLADEQSK